MENYMPLPDLEAELRGGVTSRQLFLEDMEYMAEEMYNFLPKLDFIPDDVKLKMISKFIKDLDKYKKCPSYYQEIVREYKMRTTEEERKAARLKVPEIVKDEKRIQQMYDYAEIAKRRLLELGYPVYLRINIENCMQRVRFNLNQKAINCTRDIWRAVKTIKYGTEKENERDATFFILTGITNLKDAVREELKRAEGKKNG